MTHKKINLILIGLIILLLSVASVAQAAPPQQGETQDGTTLGDSLNLDEDGNVIEEESSGGNNLGTVMSTKEQLDPTAEPTSEPTAEPTDEAEPDAGEEDGMTEEPTDETGLVTHPVANALANYFEVPYEEVMGLHESGNGFGNIAKAYFFADKLGLTPEELLTMAHQSGWGNTLKENGIHPGSIGNGKNKELKQSNKPEKAGKPDKSAGPPGQVKKNQGISDLAGPGGQANNGQSNKDKSNNGVKARSSDDNGGGPGKAKNNGQGGGKSKGKGKK